MGIFDRDYYYRRVNPEWGQSPHDHQPLRPMGGLTPAVKWLVVVNVGVFLAAGLLAHLHVPFFMPQAIGHTIYPSRFEMVFGLLPANLIGQFMLWQLVTYQFLHGSFMHIFFNMFALAMFGPHVERRMGTRSFLRLYLLGGIFAGLTNLLAHLFVHEPTVGASGSLCAVMAVFGLMNPNAVMMLFIFFLPVMLRARTFVILYAAWTAIQALVARDGIAHLAHLGGLVFGWMYVYNVWRTRWLIDGKRTMEGLAASDTLRNPFAALWRFISKLWVRTHKPRMYRGQPFEDATYTSVGHQKTSDNDWDSRIDAILDKMSREGSDALTKEEWEILRKYRK